MASACPSATTTPAPTPRAWSSASSTWPTCSKIFTLSGEPEAQAAKDAETVLAIETRLAKASLTITEQRDPQNLNHPTDMAAFAKDLTHFSLADYVAGVARPGRGQDERRAAQILCRVQRPAADTPLAQIKTYLRWQLLHAYAGTSLPESFDQENWNFYSHTSTARKSSRSAGNAAPAA